MKKNLFANPGALMLVLALLISSGPATSATLDEKFGAMISDKAAKQYLNLALQNIQKGVCEKNKPCAPATPAEFKNPPISTTDARAAMVFGLQSALAKYCELDYQRVFLPMIAFGKTQKKMNDRQLSLMVLIHGDFMGRQLKQYIKSGAKCTDAIKKELDGQLPKLNP